MKTGFLVAALIVGLMTGVASATAATTPRWTVLHAQTAMRAFRFAVPAKVTMAHCRGSGRAASIKAGAGYNRFRCTVYGQKNALGYAAAVTDAKAAYKAALASGGTAAIAAAKAKLLEAEQRFAQVQAHGGEVAANVDIAVVSATKYRVLDCATASAPLVEKVCR